MVNKKVINLIIDYGPMVLKLFGKGDTSSKIMNIFKEEVKHGVNDNTIRDLMNRNNVTSSAIFNTIDKYKNNSIISGVANKLGINIDESIRGINKILNTKNPITNNVTSRRLDDDVYK